MRHCLALLAALLLVACSIPFGATTTSETIVATPTLVGFATLAATPSQVPTVTPSPSAPAITGQIQLRDAPGLGRFPTDMATIGDKLYVSNRETDNVAVIQNNRVVKFIPTGTRPGPIAADPVGKRLYVGNVNDKTVNLIVDDAIVKTVGIGDWITALAYFDDKVYVGTQTKGTLLVLDPGNLQEWIKIILPDATQVKSIAADAENRRLYVNTYRKIVVVDTKTFTVISSFKVDGYSTLAASPQKGIVFTDGWDSNISAQYLIASDANTGKEVGRAKIGSNPQGAVPSSDGTRVYVASSNSNDVSVIDTQKMSVIGTVPVGMSPYAVELDEGNHRLYVANGESDSISVIDTDRMQVVAAVPLAILATATISNEARGRVYLANASTDSVYIIEGARIVQEIGVGRHPIDLARDEQSGRVFVANGADNTLSIIDEADYSVRTTEPVTQYLTTVAVDNSRSRVYANDVVLDLKTLKPVDRLVIRSPIYVGMQILPDWVRVHPGSKQLYVVASNGTPGSNARSVVYSMNAENLTLGKMLGGYGNVTALAFDPERNRVFLADTHPLAYTNEFSVYDANDKTVASFEMPARTMSMVYNPQTRHLFMSHQDSYARSYGPTPIPSNDLLELLDGDSFGTVMRLNVKSPGKLGRVGNTIYVASRDNWTVTLIQDAKTATAPSPTPTRTPSPYPTATATRVGQKTSPTWTPAPLPSKLPVCSITTAASLAYKLAPQYLAKLGCPTEVQRNSSFVAQAYERAQMFWREDERRIYALYGDKTWAAYDDAWESGQPEDSCPSVTVPAGRTKPIRGFGKLWCGTPGVREKAGAAIAREIGLYSAPVQKFDRGNVFGGEGGQVFVLFSDARWE